MRFLSTRTVSSQLRLCSLLLVLSPLLLGLVYYLAILRPSLYASQQTRIESALRYQALQIETWMSDLSRNLHLLAATEEMRSSDPARVSKLFELFVSGRKDLYSLVFIDKSGITKIDFDAPAGIDVSDREYFRESLQGRDCISEALVGRQSGTPLVIFSTPVRDAAGTVQGVLMCPVMLDTLSAMLFSMRIAGSSSTFLLDRAGRILTGPYARPTPAEAGTANFSVLGAGVEPFASLSKGLPPPSSYTNYNNEKVIGAALAIRNGDWVLVGEVPEAEITSQVVRYLQYLAVVSLASLLAGALLLRRTASSIQTPLRLLTSYSEALRQGRYNLPKHDETMSRATIEMRALYESFLLMAREMESSLLRLKELSGTDQLTGLANRRTLETTGRTLVEACQRGNRPCACIMVDIDHFKAVNDGFGHNAGDKVLAEVARRMAAACRGSDLCARFGGEEFSIIAPNADEDSAYKLGERIRMAVASEVFDLGANLRVQCTVSVGVSQLSREPEVGKAHLEDMLARADRALYYSKQQGRNQVSIHRLCCRDSQAT
jgi:diguanylate cyclase (GGDEF)-like protein